MKHRRKVKGTFKVKYYVKLTKAGERKVRAPRMAAQKMEGRGLAVVQGTT